ncbi:hypothetical protein [Micromonospora globbae]|uniref:hypothetical protein n=1 Tax=Micromonospora globbae TaxID=1894969 RepID=UPI00386E0291|nr:hypothetical protein OH732_10045 [Micromonospora globbae]
MTPTGEPAGPMAHPETAYPVEAYDPEGPPPALPPGHGGIAVHVWCPPEARRHTLAPMVGVDGRPATYGFGRALIVVPAGERLVEVQYVEPQRSVMVTVGEGQVVPVEYAASYDAVASGSLGTGPQRPRGRMPLAAALAFSVGIVLLCCYGTVVPFILAGDVPPLALMLAPVVGLAAGGLFLLFWFRRRRR